MIKRDQQTAAATLVLAQPYDDCLTSIAARLTSAPAHLSIRPMARDSLWIAPQEGLMAITRARSDQITIAVSAPQSIARPHLDSLVTKLTGPLAARGVLWADRPGTLTSQMLDDILDEAQSMRAHLDRAPAARPKAPIVPSPASALRTASTAFLNAILPARTDP